MVIEKLTEDYESKYDNFILADERTLFYSSNKYRKFLQALLSCEEAYLLAVENDGSILGALPSFLHRNEPYGNVLNSLPFYGSNGSIVEHEGNSEVRKLLMTSFREYAEHNDCVLSTLITSPFENDPGFYERDHEYTFKDTRTGQLTPLPAESSDPSVELMTSFDSVRRRNIRKAIKSEVSVEEGSTPQVLEFLRRTHVANITAIGGKPKPEKFFELFPCYFEYGSDYKIFTAFKNGDMVASMLLFYFNKTVEYYTPAIVEEFRNLQPLSLLVLRAMEDAARAGYRWWNWGGTSEGSAEPLRF